MNVASYSYALYVLSWRPVRQASRRSGDPDGHPLSRPVRCARHGRACPGRVAGPPAAADDRHRHHHPAVATARQLCAGRCGVGHLRADLRVAVAAGVARRRPVRPGTGAAVGRRGQRDRPAVAAGLPRDGGAGCDAVRRGDAGRLHAQRVGDGARALDRDPSRASGVADRVLAGDGIRRGHLHRRATAVGGAGGGGVAAGRRAGGGPAACSGRGCAGAGSQSEPVLSRCEVHPGHHRHPQPPEPAGGDTGRRAHAGAGLDGERCQPCLQQLVWLRRGQCCACSRGRRELPVAGTAGRQRLAHHHAHRDHRQHLGCRGTPDLPAGQRRAQHRKRAARLPGKPPQYAPAAVRAGFAQRHPQRGATGVHRDRFGHGERAEQFHQLGPAVQQCLPG
ncbi:hypothetical protein G6F50_013376 [Rhizopus delemar]|uniref:Uncharacterized protein n=1 Tax=Rhizopus delemar TaxID=936053 RepID=A0A9P7CEU1_9FUNG|nr:hypothetical protein G6F50_013376 [Rhizopus delemar]